MEAVRQAIITLLLAPVLQAGCGSPEPAPPPGNFRIDGVSVCPDAVPPFDRPIRVEALREFTVHLSNTTDATIVLGVFETTISCEMDLAMVAEDACNPSPIPISTRGRTAIDPGRRAAYPFRPIPEDAAFEVGAHVAAHRPAAFSVSFVVESRQRDGGEPLSSSHEQSFVVCPNCAFPDC